MDSFNMTKLRKKSGGLFVAEPATNRFWRAVDKQSNDKCWPWMGARHYKGYGEFVVSKGNKTKAHRFSWTCKHGAIPDGMIICHKCDNPPCCNPSHLFLGTQKTNKEDSINKHRHAYGERSGRAKLTAEKVSQIRAMDKQANFTRLSLAAKFGISGRMVTAICRYESWRHVE